MRLSRDKHDPGYANFQRARAQGRSPITVLFDGVEVQNVCITADEEKGEVVCYAQTNENVLRGTRETRHGVVQIIFSDTKEL